ncbi:MAG: hypothetical protein ACREP9_15625, partial [Candidatus Dormibacteraceae bacterium]
MERGIRHRFSMSSEGPKGVAGQSEVLNTALLNHSILAAEPTRSRVVALPSVTPLPHTEFRVFSQWGEDGIIQFLLAHIPIPNPVFVEFGVENYLEANTRYLMHRNNWSGLVLDGSEAHISDLKARSEFWRHDLLAVNSFITRENINSLISGAGIEGDIGLLSIDIDGNDYWVWEAIEVISPRIVICEYNALFGPRLPITIPYQADFHRTHAHFSNLYFGASLSALFSLGQQKGYRFIGCNSSGVNAFFVRED